MSEGLILTVRGYKIVLDGLSEDDLPIAEDILNHMSDDMLEAAEGVCFPARSAARAALS